MRSVLCTLYKMFPVMCKEPSLYQSGCEEIYFRVLAGRLIYRYPVNNTMWIYVVNFMMLIENRFQNRTYITRPSFFTILLLRSCKMNCVENTPIPILSSQFALLSASNRNSCRLQCVVYSRHITKYHGRLYSSLSCIFMIYRTVSFVTKAVR